MALSRRPGRSRPIRLFLIVMFVVPLVSLVALWGFAASTTIANAVSDHYYNQGVTIITNGFSSLTAGLPQERAQSYLWLSSGRTTPSTAMRAARKIVDQGIPAAEAAMAPPGSSSPTSPRRTSTPCSVTWGRSAGSASRSTRAR